MLRAISISKSFGPELVLNDVSFVLSPGERLGLVGPNGAGKSSLLKILAGEVQPDSGSVWVTPGMSVGYLPQYPLDEMHLSVREALLRGAGAVGEAYTRVTRLEGALAGAGGEELTVLLEEYGRAQDEMERLGGYGLEARMADVLEGLHIQVGSMDMPVAALSGGNKTKLSLARLLLSDASILLLDEPTNYLDLPALLWLERFVRESPRSYIVVSHDRRFLDRTVWGILELDAEERTLREWPGNYSAYAEARLREQQKELEAYKDQQEEIRRIEEDIRRIKEQARNVERSTNNDVQRRYAKKVARKAKSRERKLEKLLEGDDRIEKPRKGWGLHLVDLGRDPIEDDREVLQIAGLHAGYGDGDVLHGVDLDLRGHDRLAILGENGSGKSTLLRCIAGTLPYSGTVRMGPSIRPGFLTQEAEGFHGDRTVLDHFRSRTEMHEDEARTYLHKFLFSGDEVSKPARTLSYGQRAKLALAVLILSGANFLILDEPTSHLDMPALEAIERALARYRGPLLVVSHDRYFLENIGINRVEAMLGGRLRDVVSVERYEEEIAREGMTVGRP